MVHIVTIIVKNEQAIDNCKLHFSASIPYNILYNFVFKSFLSLCESQIKKLKKLKSLLKPDDNINVFKIVIMHYYYHLLGHVTFLNFDFFIMSYFFFKMFKTSNIISNLFFNSFGSISSKLY